MVTTTPDIGSDAERLADKLEIRRWPVPFWLTVPSGLSAPQNVINEQVANKMKDASLKDMGRHVGSYHTSMSSPLYASSPMLEIIPQLNRLWPVYPVHALPPQQGPPLLNKDFLIYIVDPPWGMTLELLNCIWDAWWPTRALKQDGLDLSSHWEAFAAGPLMLVGGLLKGTGIQLVPRMYLSELLGLIKTHLFLMERLKLIENDVTLPWLIPSSKIPPTGAYAVGKGCTGTFVIVGKDWETRGVVVVVTNRDNLSQLDLESGEDWNSVGDLTQEYGEWFWTTNLQLSRVVVTMGGIRAAENRQYI